LSRTRRRYAFSRSQSFSTTVMRIHVVPVPETLVRIEPEWRGFLYFVYEDEVVIVSPDDMKIVAVVPA
jgi:hypothetical protein